MAKICVFGASGRTGKLVLEEALARGHSVTAVVRDSAKIEGFEDRVTVVTAGLNDTDKIKDAVSGQDVIISALGTTSRKANTVLSDGTRNIVDAMKNAGSKRILAVTSLGCRDSIKLMKSFVFREIIIKRLAKQIWADKDRQEEVIEQSGLDYLIVRPGGLTDKEDDRPYRVFGQFETLPKDYMIPRIAVAKFLIDSVENPPVQGPVVSLV